MSTVDFILSLLQERGISQYSFSKEVGISSGNLSDWKAGRSAPKLEAIKKIADYFNVSVDYLLGRTDTREAAPSKDEAAVLLQEPYMKEIAEALRMLTPESRKLVLAQIQAVVDLEANAKK